MVKLRQRVPVRELVSIASTDRATRVSYTPYGSPGGQLYAGRAAPWKLVRKAAGEGLADFLRRLSGISNGVASGLTSAIRISVDAAGRQGVALVQTSGGALRVMPTKAAAQSMGRPSVVNGRTVDRVSVILAQAPTYSGLIPTIQGLAPGAMATA